MTVVAVTASAPIRSTDDTHGELQQAQPIERGRLMTVVAVTASAPSRSTDDTPTASASEHSRSREDDS
jgi:hypothetical protein